MTVIAWDGTTLAADKRAVEGGMPQTVSKLSRHEDTLIAIAGCYSRGVQLSRWFTSGARAEDFPALADEERYAKLLVFRRTGPVHEFDRASDPCVIDDARVAFGTGGAAAMAALILGCDARKAVEIACMVDVFCGNGVDTLTFGP